MYVLGSTVLVTWATVTTLEDDEGSKSTLRVEFATRDGRGWSTPQLCHQVELLYAVTMLHLMMYEHEQQQGGEISSGLYTTLEYTEKLSGDARHGAELMKWSPTKRRFLADVDTSTSLQATTLQMEQNGTVQHTGGQMHEGASEAGEFVYTFSPSGDARYQTHAYAQNPSEGHVATLWGVTRTSRLGDADTESIVMEQAEVLAYEHATGRGEILIPPNFADWGSDAPFAVQHASRSYLILKG